MVPDSDLDRMQDKLYGTQHSLSAAGCAYPQVLALVMNHGLDGGQVPVWACRYFHFDQKSVGREHFWIKCRRYLDLAGRQIAALKLLMCW